MCRYVLLGPLLASEQAPEEDEDDDALVVAEHDWRFVDDAKQTQSELAGTRADEPAPAGSRPNAHLRDASRALPPSYGLR